MPEPKFKTGDQARLSNGTIVTIDEVTIEDGVPHYLCTWTDEGGLNRDLRLEAQLEALS